MRPRLPAILTIAASIAAPLAAAPLRPPSPASQYVRAQAAGAAGDLDAATAGFAALLDRDPGSALLPERAYRQAIAAGDRALALRAARLLDARAALPPDGRLLLAADAVARRDWRGARAQTDLLEHEQLLAFMVPMLRGWIALGARDGDPLALAQSGPGGGLGATYYPQQRLLLLLALGRTDEAVAALTADARPIATRPLRLRLLAAAALAREPQGTARAIALLAGDSPALIAARARIAAGGPLPAAIATPAEGIADLLLDISADLDRQQLAPIALTFARIATILAPDNATGWLIAAELLGSTRRPDAALAALGHIAPGDPLASAARALRVSLLIDRGDRAAALAETLATARAPGAGAAEWARAGDIYLRLDRPADAAAAYGTALASGAGAGAASLWPLWLQRGTALELAGDWPGAEAALEQAGALAPDQPIVLNHLGYSRLSRREKIDQAGPMIERANRLKPDDPAITDSLGWLHYVRGDHAKAIELLERAAAGEPADPTINEHLGDAYWTAGRRYEARYAWRAALLTAGDTDGARLRSKLDAGLARGVVTP